MGIIHKSKNCKLPKCSSIIQQVNCVTDINKQLRAVKMDKLQLHHQLGMFLKEKNYSIAKVNVRIYQA